MAEAGNRDARMLTPESDFNDSGDFILLSFQQCAQSYQRNLSNVMWPFLCLKFSGSKY